MQYEEIALKRNDLKMPPEMQLRSTGHVLSFFFAPASSFFSFCPDRKMPAAVPDDLTGKLVLVRQRGFGEWWPAYSNDPKCESATYMSDRVDKEYTDEVEESKDWPPTNDMIPSTLSTS